MSPDKQSTPSSSKNISISGDVKDSAVIIGDNNTVNQTIIQKFFNIFKSDSETLEQRNRRILLGHVENAWIKGVLDASLHGAALLDLGIKQDPEAVTKYPWAIKKESTDETLPAGTSMQEIFDSIGMGRSLLILGAPGSGKTTMLLELARQLIAHAREDVTYPIPIVFNLASWTEKLTLADWLVQELNNLYSVPRKTAPDWVMGDKLLLLLDGLDEVRQESRAKCVEKINEFRKEHGLTSLAVCSRSQDYADLNTKLSFEGAIEVQPLTQKQITEFFNRFGKEMAGIKQVLKKDTALREMAETPLFLSIMIMAYRDKQDVDILVSGDEKARRKHLFDTYIERMLERPRVKNTTFKKQDILHWISWLAQKMVEKEQSIFLLERMRRSWLQTRAQQYLLIFISGLVFGLAMDMVFALAVLPVLLFPVVFLILPLIYALLSTLFYWLGSHFSLIRRYTTYNNKKLSEVVNWSWRKFISNPRPIIFFGLIMGLTWLLLSGLKLQVYGVLASELFLLLLSVLFSGLKVGELETRMIPNQGIGLALKSAIIVGLAFGLIWALPVAMLIGLYGISDEMILMLKLWPLLFFAFMGWGFGGEDVVNHYLLRFFLYRNGCIPLNYVPFLDHCVDLIFLRRIGGGYIFIHRLLMEHFAEMYEKS